MPQNTIINKEPSSVKDDSSEENLFKPKRTNFEDINISRRDRIEPAIIASIVPEQPVVPQIQEFDEDPDLYCLPTILVNYNKLLTIPIFEEMMEDGTFQSLLTPKPIKGSNVFSP